MTSPLATWGTRFGGTPVRPSVWTRSGLVFSRASHSNMMISGPQDPDPILSSVRSELISTSPPS